MIKHLKIEWSLLTRFQQQSIRDSGIGLVIFMLALMGPGAIDRALTHFGL